RGLKQSAETPEGFAGLIGMMAQESALPGMYDDDNEAFGDRGRRAGNDALGMVFGSKDVSRAVADQAQRASGIGSSILKQMLPVVVGMILSGLLKGLGGGGAQGRQIPAPQPMPQPGPGGGGHSGGLGDILGEILGGRVPGGSSGGGAPFPFPIPDGRGGPQAPSGGGPMPGGLGDILKDILGGGMGRGGSGDGTPARDLKDLSDLSNKLPFAGGGLGEQVFGDLLEPGHDVDRRHAANIEQLLDDLLGGRGR
ncbi:MAG TPA: DUF937 domain-containing protein, partial [Xanthobacteraceae bacterium]|nr:DUF937 domain-containing protein [Xanthobacteraceae bacterium]